MTDLALISKTVRARMKMTIETTASTRNAEENTRKNHARPVRAPPKEKTAAGTGV